MSHLTPHGDSVTTGYMKTILAFLIALSACVEQPDKYGDCMGNLPNSRTVTINTGDPIPAALVNEIQDVLISGAESSFTERYPMTCLGFGNSSVISGANNPVGAVNVVLKYISAGNDHVWFGIPFTVGNTITSGKISVYGDGAVDITAELFVINQESAGGGPVAAGTLSNVPAGISWSTIVMANSFNHRLIDGEQLVLKISNGANAGTFYLDSLRVTQFR